MKDALHLLGLYAAKAWLWTIEMELHAARGLNRLARTLRDHANRQLARLASPDDPTIL